MSEIIIVNDTDQFYDAISGDGMVIAKFETRSCVICRRIEPGLKAVAGREGIGLDVLQVDAQEVAQLAERYGVQSVPTLILFKNGNELSRCNGFQSVGMLNAWLAPHIEH